LSALVWGGPRFALQVLVCPTLDDRNDTPSAIEFDDIPSWRRRHNDGGRRALLGDRVGTAWWRPAPPRTARRTCPGYRLALIQVRELDTFRDEDID
jgi:acetyl esterase/lipase